MQPNLNITTTTNQYLAPAWVDQVLRDNFFFGQVMEKVKTWNGSQMLFPMKYQKGLASVSFSGFDVLPITQQPTTVNMVFYPSFVATNIALAGSDLSVNKTKEQTLNLMKTTMESRAQDAADDIGNFFQGDGTTYGGKAPMGLLGIVDNGSDLATYGGLARATYTGLNSTLTAVTGGAITLLSIRQLWNNISDGPIAPDLCITDYSTWAYVENLLVAYQRNTYTDFKQMTTGAAYRAMLWDGMEIHRDKKVTTGTFYELNTRFLEFYGLKWWEGESISPRAVDIEGNVYESQHYNPSRAFTWTDWIKAYNQLTVNGYIVLGGQLVSRAPFRQGKLTGITGS
jgi:hypothetical protein